MKATLIPGIAGKKVLHVDEGRCIAFMGPENAVYATPRNRPYLASLQPPPSAFIRFTL